MIGKGHNDADLLHSLRCPSGSLSTRFEPAHQYSEVIDYAAGSASS